MSTNLRGLLDDAARKYGVPGAAVAVGHRGEVDEAATGVLNRDTGVAATPDSIFQIGSVTKPLTAMLVLQLLGDDLDEPVRRHLPGFAVVDPVASETVTVRHLLTHAGGFDGDLFEDTGRGDDALDRYLAYLATAARQVHPVGALYSYCNAGFSVLGALVAKLTGGTWESALRERLIEPLGLTHMTTCAEEAILHRVSAGHYDQTVATPWQLPRSLGPVGAVVCAAPRDLVTVGRVLASDDAYAAMREHWIDIPGVPGREPRQYGLGLARYDWNGVPVFGHNGTTIAQTTQLRVVPGHDLVIAISANGGNDAAFHDAVLDQVVADRTGLTVPPRPVPPATTAPGPEELAGRYSYSRHTYDVVTTGDGLEVTANERWLDATETRTTRYVALAGDTFVTAEPDFGVRTTITFLDGGRYLHGGRAAKRT
ncbi:serine hydrolase domain-containing protein [Paractinoplanes globisporus]|uniref:Serine hydrolase domain-containing protein n=1 Tax=Paractinoplanes globisporus TaxID=113565 RepID=A0ABW6WNS9_9ACTN|nr:serine hydrolase domain-containing protein [Actinoplanes globisporus]